MVYNTGYAELQVWECLHLGCRPLKNDLVSKKPRATNLTLVDMPDKDKQMAGENKANGMPVKP